MSPGCGAGVPAAGEECACGGLAMYVVIGRMEEGRFVVPRFALHSGLRQGGGVFDAVVFLGLRPRLVWGGPLALGAMTRWAGVVRPNGEFGLASCEPTSQKRDVGHPQMWAASNRRKSC